MNYGPRVKSLLDWASNHSPRTKELHRYIVDMHEAVTADIERTKQLIKIAGQMQADRNAMAKIAFKLFGQMNPCLPWPDYNKEFAMNEDEFRLYASARINTLVMQHMNKEMTDELRATILGEGEIAFTEVASLGCPPDLIEDMRKNFHASLQLQPAEDAELDATRKV